MLNLGKTFAQMRSLYFSKGHFFWVDSEGSEHPLTCETTTIAATKDGYHEAYSKDAVKAGTSKSDLSYANIQTIQECFTPPQSKAIVVRFSLQVSANSNLIHRCDSPEMQDAIARLSQAYEKAGGYEILAKRYLENILMGNWLWRNQQTQGTVICVTDDRSGDQILINDVHERRWNRDLTGHKKELNNWVKKFSEALKSKEKYLDLLVEAKLKLRYGAEIFPSQIFSENDKASKTLAVCRLNGVNQVVFSRHKISAAIHQIDDWYLNAEQRIKTSSYGADRESLTAHRHPETKQDLFSILKRTDELAERLENTKKPDENTMNDIHFLVASLICGGLRQTGS